MKKWRLITGRGERGNAAVELALLLPLITMITFGAVDFGRLFYAYVTVASAAHEAAVYAASHSDAGQAQLESVATAESGGFLTLTGASRNTVMVWEDVGGDQVQMKRVRLTYAFNPLAPIPLKGPIPVAAVAAASTGGTPSALPPPPAAVMCPVPVTAASLSKKKGYYFTFTTDAAGTITATWSRPAGEGTLAIYAGRPFGSGSGTSGSTPPGGALASDSGNKASFSVSTASVGPGQYTVYFYNGTTASISSTSGNITYMKNGC